MTIQEALMIAGQASAIMAVLLLALAARTYVVEDIRGVSDDLSGRRRMRGMRETRKRAAHSTTRASRSRALHLADSPATMMAQDGMDDKTVAKPHEPARKSPFVVTRDVVVCPGGEC